MPKLKYFEELKFEVVHYVMDGHTMNETENETNPTPFATQFIALKHFTKPT